MLFARRGLTPREEKYVWTHHARMKLRFYRLTEARIQRIIRHPARVEESVVEGAVAVMQPSEGKRYSEIWTLYILIGGAKKKIKIISAWRYPGKSPARDPIPAAILREIKAIL
ncbi:MAG: hypothetical protein AAB533_00215 [Patescibacteria group bacterium]